MTRRWPPPKLHASRIEYIDPIDCHSAVGYTIVRTYYGSLKSEVELINCDRKITWSFDCGKGADFKQSLAKIEAATGLLTAFKQDFITHATAFLNAKKRKRKKK